MPTINELFDLSGKAAIVTGGSRGLGREMAEGLGEAGAALLLIARREQWLTPTLREFKERGFEVDAMLCDVTNPNDVQTAVNRTIEQYGSLDILVNNAGITWGAPAEEMPLEKFRLVVDVDLTAPFLFAQLAGREMIRQGSGSIINVASIAGLIGSTEEGQHIVGYVAAKGGLIAMTKELAAKWARRGVRVNAIAPGFFPSRMTERILDEIADSIRASVPMGRPGRETELKGACVFLASNASSYITGHTLVVDGGATIV